MKKFFGLFIGLFLVITLSSCDLFKSKVARNLDKIADGESFTVKLESINPEDEDESITMKVDGDKVYIDYMGMEQYVSVEDGKTYLYNNLFDVWTKEEIDTDEYDFSEITYLDIKNLDLDWFEKEDGKYILKPKHYEDALSDAIVENEFFDIDEFIEVIEQITLEDDGDKLIITVEAKEEEEGLIITISKIGETKVTLPKVD